MTTSRKLLVLSRTSLPLPTACVCVRDRSVTIPRRVLSLEVFSYIQSALHEAPISLISVTRTNTAVCGSAWVVSPSWARWYLYGARSTARPPRSISACRVGFILVRLRDSICIRGETVSLELRVAVLEKRTREPYPV
ncbi:hypothetical protein Bbelb_227770 [Branchiostoma belcheri]|nr:hypothetical protein Bbelb_227770 [Branchiostoma belcheri]